MRVLFFAVLLSLTCSVASAEFLVINNKIFCDKKKIACIRGTIIYHERETYLLLNGRLTKSCPPGVITISLKGADDNGKGFSKKIKLRIKGNYSEIVKTEKMPVRGGTKTIEWELASFKFKASKKKR